MSAFRRQIIAEAPRPFLDLRAQFALREGEIAGAYRRDDGAVSHDRTINPGPVVLDAVAQGLDLLADAVLRTDEVGIAAVLEDDGVELGIEPPVSFAFLLLGADDYAARQFRRVGLYAGQVRLYRELDRGVFQHRAKVAKQLHLVPVELEDAGSL